MVHIQAMKIQVDLRVGTRVLGDESRAKASGQDTAPEVMQVVVAATGLLQASVMVFLGDPT